MLGCATEARYMNTKANPHMQVFTRTWAEAHPNIHSWFMKLKSDPIWIKIDGEPKVLDKIGGTAS